MRIISGFYKGKKIFEPKDVKTRPLKDLTKESIFNIINHSNKFNLNLNEANILDLFSGVGSFGLECLSRGVKKVIFIENYSGVLPILKKNLISLKSFSNYEIIEKDILGNHSLENIDEKFDIIFLDPPFKNKNVNDILKKIHTKSLLTKKGVIIIHRHRSEKEIFLSKFKVIEEKQYGISKISFLSY